MNQPWETTFAMSAETFLGIIKYIKAKNRKQQEAIKQIKAGQTKIY